MKKAYSVAFATMLTVGLVSTACASEKELWENSAIHVNGTWTRATQNGLSYGDVLVASPIVSTYGIRSAAFVNPQTKFDWGIGYTYHVPCTKTRFFFHYDHFNDGHHSNSASSLVNLSLESDLNVNDIDVTGSGVVHDKSDEWTFGVDRRLAFGARYVIDAAFFLEWDKVRQSFNQVAALSTGIDDSTLVVRGFQHTYNRFRGFGPGIGIKGRGQPLACSNFGVFASFMSTMLYGKNHFNSALHIERTQGGPTTDTLFYSLVPEDTHSIVNKFDITFGLDYKRKFQLNCDSIQLGVSLGMRYLNYVNIFKNGNTFFNPPSPSPSFALNTGHAEDWGRVGPFLQVRVGGGDA